MTLFRLGCKEFVWNLWFNLFIALQLAATLFLAVTFVSSVETRYRLYLPFAGTFSSPGRMEFVDGMKYLVANGRVLTEAEFLSGNGNIESVLAGYISPVINAANIDGYGYDPRVIERLRPNMETGSWLRAKTEPAGPIPAVVAGDHSGWKPGDMIEVEFLRAGAKDDSETVTQQVRIIGQVADGAHILMPSGAKALTSVDDYRKFFDTFNSWQGKTSYLLMNLRDLESRGIHYFMNGYALVTYKTTENRDETDAYVQTTATGGSQISHGFAMEEINRRSVSYIMEQIELLLPIMIVLLLLVFTGSLGVSAVHAKKQLHSYAVYYINGSRWKQCGLIHVYSAVIGSVLAVLLCAAAFVVAERMGWLKELTIAFGLTQGFACGIVLLLSLLFSSIMPLILLGRSSAKTVLYTNG